MELHPQLRQLRDFYYKTALKLPPEKDFVQATGLIDRPSFFTLDHLKQHLNNPLLMPIYLTLIWQGKRVDMTSAVGHRVIQGAEVPFLNKGIIEDYLSNGASLVLEGLDILDPEINAMCAAIDSPHECVLSNSVVFFSQKGNEAYKGHRDSDDVLVVHLVGEKKWWLFERQPPRKIDLNDLPPEKLGRPQSEVVMRPGDSLYIKSGTPHLVETAAPFSLHMSFDICDRNVNAETALNMLIQEYNKDSAVPYTATKGVVDKLMDHARSGAFQRRIADLQVAHKENYKRARELLGANRVTYLDRLIAETIKI